MLTDIWEGRRVLGKGKIPPLKQAVLFRGVLVIFISICMAYWDPKTIYTPEEIKIPKLWV